MTTPDGRNLVTVEQFAEIKRRYAAGEHVIDIARALGLAHQTVAAELDIGLDDPTPEEIAVLKHVLRRKHLLRRMEQQYVSEDWQGRDGAESGCKRIKVPPGVATMFNRSRG